ncbi:MAG TPA: putative LPS assembly protein LptD [Candidatus Cloacimonadota bacterium]|nr:putative LPS assembly protein LptD [Candidatus Cloacimonadota bacterium]
MKDKLILSLIWIALTGLLLWSQTPAPVALMSALDSLSVADSVVTDSLFYSADSIRYIQSEEQIYLMGNTSVEYGNSSIASDSLHLDLKADRAFSHGPTVMRDGAQILLGTDVSYDIDTREGIMAAGQSKLDKGFYSGEEIRKVADDVYDIDNGRFTTCDDPDPDFWFSTRRLRIYRGDKVVGKPVIAYVNHFPVFYFPFITIPLQRGRHPGFLIPEPGYNSTDGKFIRDIAWYFPYKDFADLQLSLDIKEKTGWKLNLETDYTKRYSYTGNFDASYSHSIAGDVVNRDWAIKANHHQELWDKATLDGTIDFITNKRIWETSSDLDESLAQRLSSSLSYRQPLLASYLNVGASYTQDLINDRVTLSLPSATFSIPSRPVYELFYKTDRSLNAWWTNFAWNYSIRFDHTGLINDPSPSLNDLLWSNLIDPADSSVISEHHAGLNQRVGLSYNWKLKGWLNLRQGIDYSENWFDRDKLDNKFVRAGDYNAYFNTNFNVYGIRNYKGYIRSIRHVLTPTMGISYNPDYTGNTDYYSFGGIGVSSAEEAANLNLGLDQKWQIKYGKDITRPKKLNDVFGWSSKVSANMLKDDQPFGNISHSFTFRPGSFSLGDLKLNGGKLSLKGIKLSYSASYNMAQDPYKMRFDDLDLHSHYFSQTLGIGGTAPYTDYFPREVNRIFDTFGEPDSLAQIAENLATQDGSDNWSLSISHDLYAPESFWKPNSHNLRLNAAVKLSKNWALTYSNYYNLETENLISQSFRITRNLHCWKLDISYSRRNDFWEYKVVLFNTVLPDALRFQTRESRNN